MENDSSSLITLNNAGLFRSGRWLVRGVSLSVEMGEILTLIGPNGSGKLIIATRGRIMPLLTQGAALRNIGILGWHLVVTLEFDPQFDGIKM